MNTKALGEKKGPLPPRKRNENFEPLPRATRQAHITGLNQIKKGQHNHVEHVWNRW